MSRATILDAALKVATFVPLAVLIFYTDLPSWYATFRTEHALGFLVGALSVSSYSVYLKRNTLAAYLSNSSSSFGVGLVVVSAAVATYIEGSIYLNRGFFHYESMILLIAGYLLLRFDARIVRQLIAPLIICGFVFFPLILVQYNGRLASGTLMLFVMLSVFALFHTRHTFRTIVVPAMVLAVALGSWLIPFSEYILLAMPALVILFATWGSLRRPIEVHTRDVPPVCTKHTRAAGMDEFCAICGRKSYPTNRPFRPNLLGLVVVVIIALSIIAVQVPVLTFQGNAPYSSVYTYSGGTNNPAPRAPAGWMINSTHTLKLSGDIYASRIVFVPSFHPETNNYSLIYALGPGLVSLGPGTGEDLIGWNITLHNAFSLGPLQGAVTAYQSGSTIMMNFAGGSSIVFLNGSSFVFLNLGASFTKVYQAMSLSNASSLFEGNLSSLFTSIFDSEISSSGWTNFLHSEVLRLQELVPAVIAVISVSLIAWLAYAVAISDYRIDRMINKVSVMTGGDFSFFEKLYSMGRRERTVYEIAQRLPESEKKRAKEENFSSLLAQLDHLRSLKVVVPVLTERGSEILYAWKVLP